MHRDDNLGEEGRLWSPGLWLVFGQKYKHLWRLWGLHSQKIGWAPGLEEVPAGSFPKTTSHYLRGLSLLMVAVFYFLVSWVHGGRKGVHFLKRQCSEVMTWLLYKRDKNMGTLWSTLLFELLSLLIKIFLVLNILLQPCLPVFLCCPLDIPCIFLPLLF